MPPPGRRGTTRRKCLRQRVDGQEEVRLAGDPAPAVEGDAAAGDETVDMGVMGQRLSPRVQHRDQADPGAQAPGGERHERLGGGAHEQAIDRLLVLKGDLGRPLAGRVKTTWK